MYIYVYIYIFHIHIPWRSETIKMIVPQFCMIKISYLQNSLWWIPTWRRMFVVIVKVQASLNELCARGRLVKNLGWSLPATLNKFWMVVWTGWFQIITRKTGSFTKHPFKTDYLGFQVNMKAMPGFFFCAVLFSKGWRDLSNYHHPQTACTVMLVIIPRSMSVIFKMDTLLKFNIVPETLHSQ